MSEPHGSEPELERHAWDMVEEAEADVESLSVEAVRELWIEGTIPGSRHAPRGMLEFWADPETEYYRDYFRPERRYVLFCNEAGRSALAARRLEEMGFRDVAHMAGGFTAWQAADYPVEAVEQRDYTNRG
jgi:rhodanese-related sulfurtransferase